MKRIFLFLATNIAVMVVLSVVLSLLGVNRFLTSAGLNMPMLMVFSVVVGFTGSIISLLISKPMAKWSTGARTIEAPSNSTEFWLLDVVGKLAQRAGIAMPEVAVYDGEPNAFATGAFKNSALVAVSTGLLQGMAKDEVEAVSIPLSCFSRAWSVMPWIGPCRATITTAAQASAISRR